MTFDQRRVCESLAPASVGRIGTLVLEYKRERNRTICTHSFARSPWHHVPPMYLDDTGAAYTFLLNPAGGLVGGDEVAVAVKVQPGAHVVISSPSANRVYRSSAAPGVQTVDVHVGSDAILEWVPEVTIPFAGSRFRQVIRAQVDNGGVLLVWDSIASGRIARGERWAFALMENEINLKVGSGSSLVERVRIAPKSDDDARLAEAWDYLASFYLVGDQVSGEAWKHIEVDT